MGRARAHRQGGVVTRAPIGAAPRFAANLHAGRNALGLTQSQLAARMRTHGFPWEPGAVRHAENDQRRLRLDEADVLSEIVCVPLDRMVTETPSRVAQIAKDNMHTPVVV